MKMYVFIHILLEKQRVCESFKKLLSKYLREFVPIPFALPLGLRAGT